MSDQYVRFAFTAASFTILSLVFSIAPSYAALFYFEMDQGKGELSFTQSSLTGKGRETATLSELGNVHFNYLFNSPNNPTPDPNFIVYSYNSSSITSKLLNPVSFEFSSGDLVGIELTSHDSNSGTFFPGGLVTSKDYYIEGILTITGDSFEEKQSGSTEVHFVDGSTIVADNFIPSTVSSGKVSFTTVTPIAAIGVPEPQPLSILGSITLLGLGVGFLRKAK